MFLLRKLPDERNALVRKNRSPFASYQLRPTDPTLSQQICSLPPVNPLTSRMYTHLTCSCIICGSPISSSVRRLAFSLCQGQHALLMGKGKNPPWVYLDTDALPFIRLMIWELERGHGRMRPLTIKALRLAKDIVQLKLCPPNAVGEQNWDYPRGDPQCLKDNLARFGIDPKSGHLVDEQKWTDELARMRALNEEKAIKKDQALLKEGVRKSLRKYARPQPEIPTARQLLASAKLEQEITKTVLNGNPAPTSAWPRKIAASPDDYVPGIYGTPIPDEDLPASVAKPKVDQTKPYWWRQPC